MTEAELQESASKYSADQIQILEGLEAVRRRPAMYVGGTDARGLQNLFIEVCDNAINEAMAGHCDRIDVTLHEDGSLSVRDNGRGIPVDIDNQMGLPRVELALTKLCACGRSGSRRLRGIGLCAINALSGWLVADVWRDGKQHRIGFCQGHTTEPLTVVGDAKTGETGTQIHWKPDPLLFPDPEFDLHQIRQRLREIAYLYPGLTLTLTVGEATETFHEPRGLAAYAESIARGRAPLAPALAFGRRMGNNEVAVGIQFCEEGTEVLVSYANAYETFDGTHVAGFWTGLARAISNSARESGFPREGKSFKRTASLWQGVCAVVAVLVDYPAYGGVSRAVLGNEEMREAVAGVVYEHMKLFLRENPSLARRLAERAYGLDA